MIQKAYKNSLILERIVKLTKEERQEMVNELLKNKTIRDLGEELGVSHTTIHDWKTLRQSNKGNDAHISVKGMIRKLDGYDPVNKSEYEDLKKLSNILNEIMLKIHLKKQEKENNNYEEK